MILLSGLRQKEVIDVHTGNRLGYVSDIAIHPESGRIAALLIPNGGRMFGLFGQSAPLSIPWNHIAKIGDDLILITLPEGLPAPHET